MPIFEYKCNTCGYTTTLLEKTGADKIKDCPVCKDRDSLVRQISRSTFILKGTGWSNKVKE